MESFRNKAKATETRWKVTIALMDGARLQRVLHVAPNVGWIHTSMGNQSYDLNFTYPEQCALHQEVFLH